MALLPIFRCILLLVSLTCAAALTTPMHITSRKSSVVHTRGWGSLCHRRSMPLSSAARAASPSVIEKEKVDVGPAVLDRPVIERKDQNSSNKEKQGMGSEAWEVRIYNDGLNTREHVARSLVQVTGLSELQAYQTMMQAHQNGIAAVGRWVYEVAEMYHDALKTKGIVCDIVPVEEE